MQDGSLMGGGDAAYHRCEANKKYGRCSGDCNQGRNCGCGQPMPLTKTMEGEEIEVLRSKIIDLKRLIHWAHEEIIMWDDEIRGGHPTDCLICSHVLRNGKL